MLQPSKFLGRHNLMYVLFLPWVTFWLTVFPLFHIHPEADHAHGQTHHHHGGLVHSVLSKDLPCEFGQGTQPTSTSESQFTGVHFPKTIPAHTGSHSEISLFAINQAPDDPLKKQFIESVVLVRQDHSLAYCVAWGKGISQERSFSSYHFINPYRSRPPPVLTT